MGAYVVCSLLAIGLTFLLLEIRANRMLTMHARHEAERAREEADAVRKQLEQPEKHLHEAIGWFEKALRINPDQPVRRLKSEPKKADQIPLDLDDRLWPLRRISQPR